MAAAIRTTAVQLAEVAEAVEDRPWRRSTGWPDAEAFPARGLDSCPPGRKDAFQKERRGNSGSAFRAEAADGPVDPNGDGP